MNTSFLLSGDQYGAYRNPVPSDVSLRSRPAPSAGLIVSSYSPLRSLQYAIVLPSGDQRGYRSATPEDRVRFATAPCSAGTENRSPRASNTARLPAGDTAALVMSGSALTVRGLRVISSVTTWTGTSLTFSDGRSSRYRRPPAWKTIASGPI